ncbi:MAG: YihY/virulence factor BrkB family protein [Gemmobacter sp.]
MIRNVAARVWRIADRRHIGLISAGVAFFAMLGLFPALAAVVAIWSFAADPKVVADYLDAASDFLPGEAFEIIEQQVSALVTADPSRIGWTTAISLGAALWSARTGMAALVQGINAVFGAENRSGLRHQAMSISLTLAMVAAALIAMAAGVGVPLVLAFLPTGSWEAQLVTVARWSIAPLITLLGIGVVYRYGPNLPGRRPPLFSAGLVVAVLLWLAASEAFSFYVTSFGAYNKIYGSIGALVALLMWFYLSAYAVLLGAAVNAALAGRDQ